MTDLNLIDFRDYSHAPQITVSSGITLAHALVDACPKDAEPRVKKAQKHLKKVADDALADLAARNQQLGTVTEADSRVIDNEADRAWGALRQRLTAMAMIGEHTPKAARAAAMDALLFHGTLDFLKEDYAAQRTQMEAILRQIDDGNLGQEVDALCGPEFLAACRDVQPRYSKMAAERLRREEPAGKNMNDTVRALQTAIVHYASKVIATIDLDDSASEEAAQAALRPIDAHRDSIRRRGSAVTPPTDPNAPAAPPKTAS